MKYITNRLPLSQVYPSIICILCFYYLINLNLDISLILNCLNKYNIKYVIFSILLIYCCNILSSSRFKYILQQEGYCVPFKLIHKVNIYSLLNGMIFINFIGNSITRAKILNSHSVPEQIIFTITILEKLMGVIVLIMLSVTLTLISERHLANEIFTNNYYLLNYIIGGTWLLLGVYYLLKKDKIIDHLNLTYILTKKNCLVILITLLLTVLSYVCMACVYIAVAFSINNKIPIIPFLSKVPLVMLAASLPITINGWGLRELVSIALFSKINISSEVAIAISVAIGLKM